MFSLIDIETQDMTIEVDGNDLGDSNFQNFFIVFSYDEVDDLIYWAGARVGGDSWSIEKMDASCDGRSGTLASSSEVIDANTWYHLKITIQGSTVTVYADGLEKVRYTFPNGIPKGRIGIGGQRNHAHFDNFEVNF